MVIGPYGRIAQIQQFLLDRIDGIWRNALGRKHWAAVALLDSQHDVATTEIVKVVGESADGVQHALRIPTSLVLDALAFNGALAKQVVDVDGKIAGHAVAAVRLRLARVLF